MRMAELSRESGVAVATVKYYLREGLLHPGERTSPNQARYDDSHVRRLRLVRALLDVGGLSVSDVKEILVRIDSRETSLHDVLGLAQKGLPLAGVELGAAERDWARTRVETFVADRGWKSHDSPAFEVLVGLFGTLRALGYERLTSVLERYADAAEQIAEIDLDYVAGLPTAESIVESAVVGTVFGDALLVTLRRIAQAEASARRFE